MAKRIGLAGKDNWKSYPRAMLRARCISEGIRSVYPGCVVGVYTPEEVNDFDTPASPPVVKDMGVVEEVTAKMEGSEELIYPIFVPGSDEAYSRHATMEEWKEAFLDLIQKISKSSKLSAEDKKAKIQKLRQQNEDTFELMPVLEKTAFKSAMVQAGGTAEAPKSQPPGETEASLIES